MAKKKSEPPLRQTWDAVFAASKALVNYVKERSGLDLDGAPLVRAAFSRNNPVLAFNALANQIDLDEQEGMMHLFEGLFWRFAIQADTRFPKGRSNGRLTTFLF